MSQFDDKVALYKKALIEKCGVTPNDDLLRAVTKSLGPSIYNIDAEIVAAGEKDEVKTLKENFVKKKLGVSDQATIDATVEKAFEKMGKSNPRKYRAVLSYLIVEDLGKASLFS